MIISTRSIDKTTCIVHRYLSQLSKYYKKRGKKWMESLFESMNS